MSTILTHCTHHKLSFADRLRVLFHGTIDVYSGIELSQEKEPDIVSEHCTIKIERVNLL